MSYDLVDRIIIIGLAAGMLISLTLICVGVIGQMLTAGG